MEKRSSTFHLPWRKMSLLNKCKVLKSIAYVKRCFLFLSKMQCMCIFCECILVVNDLHSNHYILLFVVCTSTFCKPFSGIFFLNVHLLMHIIKDFVTFYARNIRDAFKIVNFCLNYIYNFACILCAWKAAVVLAQECHQPPTNCKLHLCRSVSDMTSDMQRIDRGRDFWVWSLIWDKKKRVVYQLWRPRLKWINGAKKHWLCATGAFSHFASIFHCIIWL